MNKINRIRKIGLLFIGILCFQIIFSQENYMAGYVIKTNNDTLSGYIDYRDWRYNPNKIKFKNSPESSPIEFTPTDIIEFKVANEIYVAAVVETEISPNQTNNLNEDPNLHIVKDTTFLQTFFKANKSLYYYKNSQGKENFYIKQGSNFELLIYKKYLAKNNGKDVVTENKKYIGQLTLYLKDCATINSVLNNTTYQEKSLIKLFQYYYNCSSSEVSFQRKIKKLHPEIGIIAGISSTSLQFRSDVFAYLVEAGYKNSTNFSYGVYFDFKLPRYRGKWSINNEILVSKYEVTGNYLEYESEEKNTRYITSVGYKYLKINNIVRYKHPIGHSFLFINGGISNGFSINEINALRIESKFYSTNKVEYTDALSSTRKHEQGLILGSGIKKGKYSFEARYEIGNGMSVFTTLKSTTQRFYFLMGYKF